MKGNINWYNNDKGYGFIVGADGEKYFFHISNFNGTDGPNINDLVEFTSIETARGKTATEITLVSNEGSKMILIDNYRIRVGDIKTYSIQENTVDVAMNEYEKEMSAWQEQQKEYDSKALDYKINNTGKPYAEYNKGLIMLQKTQPSFPHLPITHKLEKGTPVLVIALYNKQTICIYNDIEKWLDKLDKLFCLNEKSDNNGIASNKD